MLDYTLTGLNGSIGSVHAFASRTTGSILIRVDGFFREREEETLNSTLPPFGAYDVVHAHHRTFSVHTHRTCPIQKGINVNIQKQNPDENYTYLTVAVYYSSICKPFTFLPFTHTNKFLVSKFLNGISMKTSLNQCSLQLEQQSFRL